VAITLGDVLVMIRGDRSQLGSDLGGAEQQTRGWAANLGGTVMTAVGGAVVAGATAAAGAVVGIGAAAVNVSGQIDRATDNMVTRLGVTQEQAEHFAGVITRVYGDGFAENIEEAGLAVEQVFQNLGEAAWDLSQDEMAGMTEQALALRDAFGVDVSESLRSAGILMANMGVTGDEAMSMIAAGFQNGLNRADDLLDTFNEYADDFRDFGMTGEETLGFLNRGLEAGIFNTDRMGDAINEFGVNLRDPAIRDGLFELDEGLGAIYDQFAQGEITEREAFEQIVAGLQGMEDPIARDTAGVLFFRSMWEDLGEQAIFALGDMQSGLVDVAGATDALNQQYDNLGSFFEGMRRRLTLALAPLGDRLLEMVNRALPTIEQLFSQFEAQLPAIMDVVEGALGGVADFLMTQVLPAAQEFADWLINEAWPAIVAFAQPIIEQLIPGLEQLATWIRQIAEAVLPVLGQAIQFVIDHFDVFGPILAVVGGLILALTAPVAAIIAAIVLLATAWANNWGDIQGRTGAVVDWFNANIRPTLERIFGWITNEALPFLRDLWQTVWAGIQAVIERVLPIIQAIVGAFQAAFRGDWEAFGSLLRDAWDMAWQLIGDVLRGAGELFLTLLQNAVDAIWRLITETDWLALGRRILEGIANGIRNAISAVTGAIGSAMQAALDAARGFLRIGSPSALFRDEIGSQIVGGIIEGIMGGVGRIREALLGAVAPLGVDLTPQLATAGASAGGQKELHVHFEGGTGAPQTPQEAEDRAYLIADAIRRRGLD
jgi:phage-related minor tail protein